MNDEIREILDIERYRNKDGYVENISVMPDEIHKLLDYITNLQQENEELKKMCELYSKSLYCAELTDYKSRVEKAVENLKLKQIRYVNESDYVIDDGDLQEEINILQNGSDEE